MIIDVNKLIRSGLEEGVFELNFEPQRELTGLPGARIAGGVKVNVKVRPHGRSASAAGEVSYTIEGECSRCLAPARVSISEPFNAEYGMGAEAEYPIKAGLIDLTAPVEEAVILSSPQVIYCKSDCKGVCPICGANLNDKICKCNTEREV